jgi:hypothetical protein
VPVAAENRNLLIVVTAVLGIAFAFVVSTSLRTINPGPTTAS